MRIEAFINKEEYNTRRYRYSVIIRKLGDRYLVYLVILYIIIVSSKVIFDFLITSFSLSINLRVKSRRYQDQYRDVVIWVQCNEDYKTIELCRRDGCYMQARRPILSYQWCVKGKGTVIILSPPRGSDALALQARYYEFERYVYIISEEISRRRLKDSVLTPFFSRGSATIYRPDIAIDITALASVVFDTFQAFGIKLFNQ